MSYLDHVSSACGIPADIIEVFRFVERSEKTVINIGCKTVESKMVCHHIDHKVLFQSVAIREAILVKG